MRSTLKFLGLVGALCLTLGAARAGAENAVVDQLTKNARYWQEHGRDDKASEAWEKVLRANPSDTEALASLAMAEARAGRTKEAREYLAQLKKARPNAPDLPTIERSITLGRKYDQLLAEARAQVRAGKPEEAIAKYREAFGSSGVPRSMALEYLQTLGGTQDGWQEALDGLQKFAKKYPDDTRYKLAIAKQQTYREQSRVEGIQLLQKLSSDPSTKKEAVSAWKQALLWMPLVTSSEPLFADYLKVVPGDAEITKQQASIKKGDAKALAVQHGFEALERADVKEADKIFKSAGSEPEALVGQAIVALKREDFDKARALLERVKLLAPDRPAMWAHSLRSATFWSLVKQAKTARHAKKEETAEAKLLDAIALATDERPHAELALADLYLSQKSFEKAEPHLRTVLEAQPGNADALRAYVTLLLRTGRAEEARAANELLTKADPKKAFRESWLRSEELRGQATLDKEAGRFEEAHTALLAARDADPENTWALHDLANIDMETGDLAEAGTVLARLLELEPNLPEALIARARLLSREGKNAAALETIVRLKPDQLTPDLTALKRKIEFQIDVDRVVAKAMHSGGRRASARQELLVLERRSLLEPELMAIVALAWSDLREYEKAVGLMQDAMVKAQTPTSALRLQMAAILLRAGDEVNLAVTLDQINNDPALSPQERKGLAELRVAHGVRRADSLREDGELTLAFAQLNPLLQEYPDHPKLMCALGRLFQAQDNYQDAHAVFLRVLSTDQDNREAREGAINTAFLMGKPRDARRIAEEGVAYAPRDPRMHLILGRYWLQADDDAKAMSVLQEAQQLADGAVVKSASERDGVPMLLSTEPRGQLTASSNTNAILRKASAHFGGTEIRENGPSATAEQEAQAEVQEEIDRIRARHRLQIDGRLETRRRDGESGLGALTELRLPIEAGIPLAYTGRLSFRVTPVIMDAGTLALSNVDLAQRFGSSVPELTGASQSLAQTAQGTELRLGYKYKSFSADIGTSPLGFTFKNIVGGIEWRQQFGSLGIAVEASRRSVRDSLLSYSGLKDPSSGIVWGGVLKQGGRLDLAILTAQATYFLFGDFRLLNGVGVQSNRAITAGLGVEWKLYDWGVNSIVTGANIVGLGYEKNLRYFTLGHGGYFSPQAFAHVGIPVRWSRSGKFQFDITAEPGVNWFREDQAAYYPSDEVRQAQREQGVNLDGTPVTSYYAGRSSVSFALNVKSRVSYPITDDLKAALDLSYHSAADYQEFWAGLNVIFDFTMKRSHGESDARY